MSRIFPSAEIAKKLKLVTSATDTVLSSTITVPAQRYGILWKLWVDCDVDTETDIENLPGLAAISITIGSTVWGLWVHPFIAHVDAQTVVAEHRTVDLGPWPFDFGPDGLYSGVKGDDIVVTVASLGTGNKSSVKYLYSGD